MCAAQVIHVYRISPTNCRLALYFLPVLKALGSMFGWCKCANVVNADSSRVKNN